MYDYRLCCLCNNISDENGHTSKGYAVHGRGKNKITNYFHKSCFYKTTKLGEKTETEAEKNE